MPTLGNTSTSFTNWIDDDNHSGSMWNECGSPFTVPAGGIVITDINVCVAADVSQGSCNAQLCVWNQSTGALIVASSVYSMAAKTSRSTSGWSFTTQSVTPTYVAGGTVIVIGFYRVPTGSLLFPVTTSSGTYDALSTSASSPGSISGYTAAWAGSAGNMGAYVTYQTVIARVWNGTSWVVGSIYIWNGSSWVIATGDSVWNGTSWVQAT
jgi:hypothetical protein